MDLRTEQVVSEPIEPSTGEKRPRDTQNMNEISEVFISNIPFNVSEAGLISALKRIFSKSPGFVQTKKVTTDRGFAIVEFESAEAAKDAIDQNRNTKLGPRTLNMKLNDPGGAKARRMEREVLEKDQKGEEDRDTDPNPDCWFCLANPNAERSLIFGVDPSAEVYLSSSKGPITPMHSFVCPVTHYGCYAQADEKVRRLCDEYGKKMTEEMQKLEMETIIFERWIPLHSKAANHMQVHFIPFDKSKFADIEWSHILKDQGRKMGVDFIRVRDHEEVCEKMRGILNKVSYLFMSFPCDGERENWLGVGKLSFTFPREVICSGLKCPERTEWKSCEVTPDEASKIVETLRNLFYPS
jgi:RNA recognition motif-containing protein